MTKHTPTSIQPQLPFDDIHPGYIALAKNSKNLTGQQFGRLTALGPVGKTPSSNYVWLCRCDCGNTTTVTSAHLRTKNIRSCGCLTRKSAIASQQRSTGNPLYNTWVHIIQRCTNPKNKQYRDYGGRGITICAEWKNSFMAFHDYFTILPNYGEKGYTIDRVNNNGNYEPGNVRWATATEQVRNARSNVLLTHGGKTKCISEWALDIGVKPDVLYDRIRSGWSDERAITTPVKTR